MFKALMGGGPSSSDLRSSTSSSSKSSSSRRRRTDSSSKKSSKSSSSRGDDRDRGLGDLSAYPSSSSVSRHKDKDSRRRRASSVAGESVASSNNRDRDSRSARSRGRDRSLSPESEPEPEPIPRALEQDDENEDGSSRRRRERRVKQPGDLPPLATGGLPTTAGQFAANIASPGFSQFPTQYDNNPNLNNTPSPISPSGMPVHPVSPAAYDPHVAQQFPGQLTPTLPADPYRPLNPAGEAADYYGDQGQSIQDQPGVRPKPPAVIPNSQAHLMPASPLANPPEEPSSMGQVGAAADYYGGSAEPGQASQQSGPQPPKPKPSKPSKPSKPAQGPAATDASGMATHGSSESSAMSPTTPGSADPQSTVFHPHKPSHSHIMDPAIGAAAAGYMANQLHHSPSPEQPLPSPYTNQNYEPYSPNVADQTGQPMHPGYPNPALNGGYAAHPMHPDHQAVYHASPFQSGGLAFQQRQRNPLNKFIDFWRDPEGAGEFEEYTEAIGVCKYCFEPGTTSRDAPRKHNYRRGRRSSDRFANSSRVDKSIRYSSSSDDESRRRSGSSKKSWLGGLLSGYAVKSVLDNKDFGDSYNVRPARISSPRLPASESESESDRKSETERGIYRRSPRSRSPGRTERSYYSDPKRSMYEGRRSRSRSNSSSRSGRHSAVRDAALGAAIGSVMLESKPKSVPRRESRSRSPKRSSNRKISSSESSSTSYFDISRPTRKSVGDGLGSFFTSSSENRRKRKPKRSSSIFSFNNSSSSSLDADLAFGSAYTKKPSDRVRSKKSKGNKTDEDVDARLLGLSAAATALASPRGHGRRSGEVLAGKDSRSRRPDYASSATNDEDWEDLDSEEEASSVSSALAFGGSSLYGHSDSSDPGTSKWDWRWGSKKDKKKNKGSSSKDRFPTGPVLAAGAGAAALGTAALASGYRKEGKKGSSSSSESLQRVVPVPTSDPGRFDTVTIRPGPIPLQQPQPVAPVSQSVYTSQGDSVPAYSAPAGPPFFGAPDPHFPPQFQAPSGGRRDPRDEVYPERSDVSANVNRSHRRNNSSPVYNPEPFQGSTVSSFKRRSIPKDQASVQFDLTEEQANKERQVDRRERKKRDSGRDTGIQLLDKEYEEEPEILERRRRDRRRNDDYDDPSYSQNRRVSPDRERRRRDHDREKDSSSWIPPAAAVGTIGAAAVAASALSRRSSDDASEASQRREKRRAERRRTSSDRGSETSSQGRVPPPPVAVEDATRRDNQPRPGPGEYSPSRVPRNMPEHDDYAAFFAPEGLRYSPDVHTEHQECVSMPTIVEVEPASEKYAKVMAQAPEPPYQPNYGGLPWPVPQLNLIEPTPPQSWNGSARDNTSPVPPSPEPPQREAPPPEPQTTGSRVSWGEHQTHENEVPSTSSEQGSVDHDVFPVRDVEKYSREKSKPKPKSKSKSEKNGSIGHDIEFAAALAAGAAYAGFDPAMVTDDPTYHTRSSPPEYESERRERSGLEEPWERPAVRRVEPHGFVEEGEVETPGADGQESRAPDYITQYQPEPKPTRKNDTEIERQRSLAREALEKPGEGVEFQNVSWKEGAPNGDADVFSMPGSFDPDEFTEKSNDEPKPRSVVSEGSGKDKKEKRRKKRQSRDSANHDDTISVTSSPGWIGEERQSRKGRREERRRERDSAGQAGDWEDAKGLDEDVQTPDASAWGRPFALDLDSRLRSRSISPPASARTVDPGPKYQSRPSSPEMISDQEHQRVDGDTSRRSSILHDSPTAIPLHFRRPPSGSSGTQRSPTDGSSGSALPAQSPESPTQKRSRRPTSSEFVKSREIRPLWLVERHGTGKNETQQPIDEPLPSLPSSKTSSRTPSMEDLRALPEENSWETVDRSREILPDNNNRGLAISVPSQERQIGADYGNGAERDILDSQQATPTKTAFEEVEQVPYPAENSEKPKYEYEFHTPSELLRDPTSFVELPPFTESSAVGVNEEGDKGVTESRPSTPQDKQIPVPDEGDMTTPTQDSKTSDVLKGAGLAGVLGATVAAAVDAGNHEKPDHATVDDAPPTQHIPTPNKEATVPTTVPDVEVKVPATRSADKGETTESTTPTGYGTIVDAAMAEATGSTDDKPAAAVSDETKSEQPRSHDLETAEPAATSESSSKKKKKNNKKNKKNKSMDVAGEEQQQSPAHAPEHEHEHEHEQESTYATPVAEHAPETFEAFESSRELGDEPTPTAEGDSAHVQTPTVEETAPAEQTAAASDLEQESTYATPVTEHAPEVFETSKELDTETTPTAEQPPQTFETSRELDVESTPTAEHKPAHVETPSAEETAPVEQTAESELESAYATPVAEHTPETFETFESSRELGGESTPTAEKTPALEEQIPALEQEQEQEPTSASLEAEHFPEPVETSRKLGVEPTPTAEHEPANVEVPTVEEMSALEEQTLVPEQEQKQEQEQEQEPTSAALEAEHFPGSVETSRELEAESTPTADTAEPSPTATSSKKAKHDKKKKKSKGGASEGDIAQSTEEAKSETETGAQPTEDDLKVTGDPAQVPTEAAEAVEEPIQSTPGQAPEPTLSSENAKDVPEPEASRELPQSNEDLPVSAEADLAREVSPEATQDATQETTVPHEQDATEPVLADTKPETERETDIALSGPEPAIEDVESAVPPERSLEGTHDDGTVPEQDAPGLALGTDAKEQEPEAPAHDGDIGQGVSGSAPAGTKPGADGQDGAPKVEELPVDQEQTAEAPTEAKSVTAEPETPRGESMPADTVETSEPAEDKNQPASPDQEPETALSRKNSKKNKKKNKRNNAAETPTEQEPASKQPQTEEVAPTETEPPVTGEEQPQDPKPEEIQQHSEEEHKELQDGQPASKTVEPIVETPPDATEEVQEESSKEKNKNKKNRKSAALSEHQNEPETLPESEPKPEQLESVDTADTRQISGEVSEEPADVRDVEPALAATDEGDPPVEKSEANNGSPHVSAQPNVELEPAPEPDFAITPQDGDEEERKYGTIPDEAVPEPSSNTDVNNTDVTVAPEEPSITTTQESSKEEEQPIEEEMSRDTPIDVPEREEAPAEEDAPMTAAQRKKAKKDKKKKRQSVPVEETATSEPAETVAQPQEEENLPVGDAAPAEESRATQEAEKERPAAVDIEPAQEQPKDEAVADITPTPVSEEPAVAETHPDQELPKDDVAAGTEVATAVNEADVADTEPIQETVSDDVTPNVETAATSEEPILTETKPTDEAEGDVAVQEVPKEEVVNAAVDAPTEADEGTEKGLIEDNALDATTQNQTQKDLTTESAQEPETVAENDNISQDKSLEEVQEPGSEPASSAKSKKNKKKKKDRQSTLLDDEQPTSTETETPIETETVAPSAELPSETDAAPVDTPAVPDDAGKPTEDPPAEPVAQEEESRSVETPVMGVEPTEDPPVEPVVQEEESKSVETPVTEAEPTEEPQTVASKKKAKKDKKKRKSVAFETEQPPGHPDESVSAEPATPAESAAPVTGDETAPIAEQKPDGDVSAEQSPAAPNSASTDGLQIDDTPLDTPVEPIAPNFEDQAKPDEEETEKETPSDEAAKSETAIAPEAEPTEVKEETKSDLDAQSTAPQLEVTPKPTEANPLPTAESEPQTPTAEGEEAASSKSKKNKKKKKKGKASEADEEASAASPEPSNGVPAESEKALDVDTPEPKQTEPTEPTESKEPELATPEAKEPESIELASEATEAKEAQEPAQQPEKLGGEDTSTMSKSKKKAKKDKKRQSKNLDNNDAEAQPSTEDKPTGPSLETATAPVEDYGKEHQSRDTENDTAGNEKDLFWTDQIVSSQVEQQQQATPSDDPSKPASEHVQDDYPADISGEAETNNALSAVNEPEASGEIATDPDNERPAEVAEGNGDGKEDDGARVASPQEEEAGSKDEPVEGMALDLARSVPKEEAIEPMDAVDAVDVADEGEQKQTATEAPVNDAEAVAENIKSEEPPEPDGEDFSPSASGNKKKKDKKKKQKQQEDVQVEESRTKEPSMDNAKPVSIEPPTITEAEQPAEVEATQTTEEPTREVPVSAEETVKELSVETKPGAEPAELSKDTASPAEDFEPAAPSKKKSKKDKKKNKKSLSQETGSQSQPGDTPVSGPSSEQHDAPMNVESTETTNLPSGEIEPDKQDIDEPQADVTAPADIIEDTKRSVEVPSGEAQGDTIMGDPVDSTHPPGSDENPVETTDETADAKAENEGMEKGTEEPEELPSTQEESRNLEIDESAAATEQTAAIDAGEPLEKSISDTQPPLEAPFEQPSGQEKEEELPELPKANEETVEEAEKEKETTPEPLSRKESKKKKKKGKKQAKEEEQEELATPTALEEVVPDVSESVKEPTTALPEGAVGNEQVEATEPSVSYHTQKEVDVPTELPESDEQKTTTDEPKAGELEEKAGQDNTRSETLENQDGLGIFDDQADLPKEPEALASLSRRLSKKERKKAKQKGIEPGRKSELDTSTEPIDPQPTQLPDEQPTTKARHAEQAPEDEKARRGFSEQTFLPSPETRPVSLGPAIAEFDEAAVPEGVVGPQDTDRTDATVASEKQEPENGNIDRSIEAANETLPADEKAKEESDMPPRPLSRVASVFPELKRGAFRRPASNQSLKDRADEETMDKEVSREDAIQVSEAPITSSSNQMQQEHGELPATSTVEGPSFERSTTTEPETPVMPVGLGTGLDPSYHVPVLSDRPGDTSREIEIDARPDEPKHAPDNEMPLYATSPLHERSSGLVGSSPIQKAPGREPSPSCELQRSPSIIHGRHESTPRSWSLEESSVQAARTPSPPRSPVGGTSPPRTPLHTITEQEPENRVGRTARTMDSSRGTPRLEMKPEHVLPRPESPTPVRKFTDNAMARQAWPRPDKNHDEIVKTANGQPDNQAIDREWPAEALQTPEKSMPILRPSSVKSVKSAKSTQSLEDSPSFSRSLRRSGRNTTTRSTSGDLRAASRALEDPQPPPPQPPPSDLNVERIASSSSYDPVTDKGKRPVRGMMDVYEAWGETPNSNSPRSPSRPPSVRHRRSMQHLQEVEIRLDQLISENRLLVAAREAAEDQLRKTSVARRKSDNALNTRDTDLRDREAELDQLQNSVEWFQKDVARLTKENDGLATTNASITAAHALEIQATRESSARQLEDLRSQYQQVSTEMQDRVRREVDVALAQKNADLRRLREELESARDKVKRLQEEIAASVRDDVLVFRDEDFFDAACQKLCGHVQQWVLRFSKHSDHRRCRKLGDLHDEKLADRFDNAILDGSDADAYLGDRVRRRDVFMSVVMTMVWEFIFTRYLFGMDREQRQKLKSLEKQLSEVGPRSAVHHWRATTLSLLSKRPSFTKQREADTEAVALEIFNTLTRLLPPPTHAENQLLESLRKVLRVAVTLSVEMRAQLAEYIMLPPLQPEYNTNGDVARLVYFNASLMNERSGETTSNNELETKQLPVRIVLFPLVVKKGNDKGEGEDEVVVCPAQVLVARLSKDKNASHMLGGERMSIDANRSVHSVAPSSNMDMSNLI